MLAATQQTRTGTVGAVVRRWTASMFTDKCAMLYAFYVKTVVRSVVRARGRGGGRGRGAACRAAARAGLAVVGRGGLPSRRAVRGAPPEQRGGQH